MEVLNSQSRCYRDIVVKKGESITNLESDLKTFKKRIQKQVSEQNDIYNLER